MGVDLSDLIKPAHRTLGDFRGKVIAIDAFNTLYQFLAIIRQPDGTPLNDRHGRVPSPLTGLIYRTSNFVGAGIKPAFGFDGEAPRRKARTISARVEIKKRAEREWREAVAVGDLARARTKAMQTSRLTPEMVEQSRRFLNLVESGWVQAPAEGEAQAAFMAQQGGAWGVGSQDHDALLFGAPVLVKNLAITGRRKLPRKNVFVDVAPEEIHLDSTLKDFGVTREQLVDIGILIGTDFNEGVRGIGPKKALAGVKKHGNAEGVLAEGGGEIDGLQEGRGILLQPRVEPPTPPAWRPPGPDLGRLRGRVRRGTPDRGPGGHHMAPPPALLPPFELRGDAVSVRPEGGPRGPGGASGGAPLLERPRKRHRGRGGRGVLVPLRGAKARSQRPRLRQRSRGGGRGHPRERDRRAVPERVPDHDGEEGPGGDERGDLPPGTGVRPRGGRIHRPLRMARRPGARA